jgi:FlaA1/EpsC-like NDP-sugar epimerase
MKKIIIIGAGGHAKSCIDVIEKSKNFKIIGLFASKKELGNKILGYNDPLGHMVEIDYCYINSYINNSC